MSASDSELLAESLRTRIGSECIYQERMLVMHTRLASLDAKDSGILCTLTVLDSPGFLLPHPSLAVVVPELSISSSWEYFQVQDERWSAIYGGWRLYFSAALIERATVVANELRLDSVAATAHALQRVLANSVEALER